MECYPRGTVTDKDSKDDSPDSTEAPREEPEESSSESEEQSSEPPPSKKSDAEARSGALPEKVERALAAARAAAKADHERKGGRWLAVIPASIGVIFLLFMLPRSTPPDGVPLPRVDHRVTAAVARAEEKLADEAEQNRLPGDILQIGTAIRELNALEGKDEETQRLLVRGRLDAMITGIASRPGVDQELIQLRSAQIRTFVNALREWEAGREPPDFAAAGGTFVDRAREAGWVEGRRILLDETQRRVAFKTVWNAMTHLSQGPYSLTLDEERALYSFYITHPRVPEGHRIQLEMKRHDAKTPEECAQSRAEWRREMESWRADKIKRLAAIDPSYPGYYALGIVHFQAGHNDLAVDAFNTYLQAHPEGPYALRARNHLKASFAGTTR